MGAGEEGQQRVRKRKSLFFFWEGGRAITGRGHRRRNRFWGKGEICLKFVQEVVETCQEARAAQG